MVIFNITIFATYRQMAKSLRKLRALTPFAQKRILITYKTLIFKGKRMQEIELSRKTKSTVYMSENDEMLLNEVFIKRLRERKKTDKSALFCEGIRLLYEKEMEASKP